MTGAQTQSVLLVAQSTNTIVVFKQYLLNILLEYTQNNQASKRGLKKVQMVKDLGKMSLKVIQTQNICLNKITSRMSKDTKKWSLYRYIYIPRTHTLTNQAY